jgi:hypothetical protein
MKLSLPPKLVEKLVWVPVLALCKIFILSYMPDAILWENWPFSPPNRVTIWITLTGTNFCPLEKSYNLGFKIILFIACIKSIPKCQSKEPGPAPKGKETSSPI